MPVSNQGVQSVGVHVDYCELDLVADLHTETDLGEKCVIVLLFLIKLRWPKHKAQKSLRHNFWWSFFFFRKSVNEISIRSEAARGGLGECS